MGECHVDKDFKVIWLKVVSAVVIGAIILVGIVGGFSNRYGQIRTLS